MLKIKISRNHESDTNQDAKKHICMVFTYFIGQ